MIHCVCEFNVDDNQNVYRVRSVVEEGSRKRGQQEGRAAGREGSREGGQQEGRAAGREGSRKGGQQEGRAAGREGSRECTNVCTSLSEQSVQPVYRSVHQYE